MKHPIYFYTLSTRPAARKVHPGPVLLILFLLSVSGCVSTTEPTITAPTPTRWHYATNPRTLERPPTDLHIWWKKFHDAQLNLVVDNALQSNLDLSEARERLLAVRTLYRYVDAPFLPSVKAASSGAIDPDAATSYTILGFDSVWETGLFGRAKSAAQNARGQLDAAVATLRATRVSLVSEVVLNWIKLRSAQQQQKLENSAITSRQHYLKLVKTRAGLGLASPSKVMQASAELASARASLSEPRQVEIAAAQRLAMLLGLGTPKPEWLQPGPLPQLGALEFAEVPAELLRTRPEIARAEANVIRSAGELGLARADMYPSISLGASLLWSTRSLTNPGRDGIHSITSIGPAIDIPLFDWGLRAARRDNKAHQLKASLIAYRQAVLTGVTEVETALGTLQQLRFREQNTAQALRELTDSARSLKTRDHLGLANGLQLNQAFIARDQSALALVKAKAARDIAYVALYKALGGAAEPQTQTAMTTTMASESQR